MKNNIKRRKFLEDTLRLSSGLVFVPVLLQRCQSGAEKTSEKEEDNAMDVTSCDDLSKTPEAEIKKREGFGYVEESPMPDKQCHNCQMYLPPNEGHTCGGCAIAEGPVFKEGYCTYWTPIV